jgi:aryl-alcohol dehydrogenase-like predicted oxidoreductase
MRFRKFGRTDWEVSEVGFGAWAIGGQWGGADDQQSIAALHQALDLGINFIDTAAGYGDGRSERLVAETLRQRRGETIYVATKTPPAPGPWPPSPYCRWQDRYSAAYLRENIEQRLQALQTDRIDLLQLHTWTPAWNDDPQPLLILQRLREEGKIGLIGISTPEQDQGCVIQLMRDGLVDCVQVIYNLFHQEPAAQMFPVAEELGVAILVRVPLDEGALTGKYPSDHRFPETDFRHRYFRGDRMERTMQRVDQIAADLRQFGLDDQYSLADLALKFALAPAAVSSVLVGVRNPQQALLNAAASDKPALPEELIVALRRHNWLRGVWYGG